MQEEMTVDDLRCDWEEDGESKVEQLDKFILSKGAWVTIMFLYRERGADGAWSEAKCRIQRYRKMRGKYMSQNKFNISSANQAHLIADQLQHWFPRP
jgi:hypothetical protein